LATFCLLHGNWHDGSCWQPLVDCLEARGHKAAAPDFRSTIRVGVEPIELPCGHYPMLEDPEGLADLLSRLADAH
jgi:pimeloyl-ACP methyl ester carboxylesterase